MQNLGMLIQEKHLEISSYISKSLDIRYNQFLNENNIQDDAIVKWRGQLVQYIGLSLVQDSVESVWNNVIDWATQTSAGAYQYHIQVDELLQTVKIYREVIWKYIEDLINPTLSVQTFLKINRIIDNILDQVAYVFSTTYVKHHSKTLRLIKESILEVSTPIVSISETTGILPLIGEIDTYRAKVLMEKTLSKCVELKKTKLIIDLSGVAIIDTMVAHELFKVTKALSLIGVEAIFTGIRPEIAEAMVRLGVDFSEVQTVGSLEQALKK